MFLLNSAIIAIKIARPAITKTMKKAIPHSNNGYKSVTTPLKLNILIQAKF